jgi:aminoglycoside N3'-acetyltransferase
MAHERQAEVIKRTTRPVTVASIVRDLRALGVALGDKLLVHTSLSMLGFVLGGAQAVVEALLVSVGSEGLIAMDDFSPLGRLYEADARVLLLGPSFQSCTSFHLAECRSGKLPPLISTGAPLMMDGGRRWIAFTAPDFQGDDFEDLGSAFEKAGQPLSTGKVGEATCRLFRMRAAVDFAVEWLRTYRE